jgi:hypothetical protein
MVGAHGRSYPTAGVPGGVPVFWDLPTLRKDAAMTIWTDPEVAAVTLEDGISDRRVSVHRGLYLRLRRRIALGKPTLSKRWEYRSKVGKRAHWLALGQYPTMSLEEAKAMVDAMRERAEMARASGGEHPILALRAKRRRRTEENLA